MFAKFKGVFDWPMFHMGVKLKVKTAIGAETLYCNPARSDFRPGARIVIIEGDNYEVAIVDEVNVDNVVVVAPLTKAWSPKATVAPLTITYSNDNVAVVRRPSNKYATSTFTFYEAAFLDPFIEDDQKVALQEFGDYPVLNRRAIGGEFPQTLISGLEITDYGGLASLRSRWAAAKWTFNLAFKSPRGFEPEDWLWWRTFADYCRGSTNPFYLPTFREDFEVVVEVAGGGNQIRVGGSEFRTTFYPIPSFRTIVITKPDGTQHFATVTAVADVGGNDRLTFAPALPAGDWTGQAISFLLKCRLADDTVTTEHSGLNSLVTLNIQTVD